MADDQRRPEPVDLGRFKNVTPWDGIDGCCGDCIGFPIRSCSDERFTDDEIDLIVNSPKVLADLIATRRERDDARKENERLSDLLGPVHSKWTNKG